MPRGEPLLRQWSLLRIIQESRFGISTNDLSQRLEYSRRQVQRDIKVLVDSGFPIYFEEGMHGKKRWRLSFQAVEKYRLALSLTEILSLYLAEQLLVPLIGTPLGSGIHALFSKAKAILPDEALEHFRSLEDKLLVKNAASSDYSEYYREISTINTAISEGRVLSLRYRSSRNPDIICTDYHPYGLIVYGTNVYVIGWMTKRKAIRTIKVNRIVSVHLKKDGFDYPRGFSLAEYLRESFGVFTLGDVQRIRVKFTKWAAVNVREHTWHHSQTICEDTGPYLIAEFNLYDTIEFTRWILGFGRLAVVLEPQTLVVKILDELQAAVSNYHREGQ
jgi:predicted DNA-binding transcriptional regulator YafY